MRTRYARRVGQILGMGIMAMLVVGLLQAAVAVKAQEPAPNDPMSDVPVHWYANPGGNPVIGPDLPLFGADVTDVRGDWELQIDWQNWDTFWGQWQNMYPLGHPLHFGPIQTGVVAAPFSSSWATVRWTAGIWEAEELGRFSPAREFQGIDVQFWKDVVADGIFNPAGDLPLGPPDRTNVYGDALCPSGPCPYLNASPGTPYGVQYKFTISLENGDNSCGSGGLMPGGNSSGIPHFFTVHGRDMSNGNAPEDYTCMDSLAGQIWNCQANGNCQQFQ